MGSKERDSSAVPYFALGLGIGVVAGALAGLLLAPKPGKETREELLEKAKKAAENLKGRLEEVAAKVYEENGASGDVEKESEIEEISEGGL